MIRAEEYRVVPWRNGGGVTREIAVSSQRDPEWRLSLARIERDGPFSDFTGYDRTIVTVEGAGCSLHIEDGQRVELQRLVPFAFLGEWAVTAEVSQGPVVDLNVMTLRSRFRHRVAVLPRDAALDERDAVASFRYVVEGPGAGDTLEGEALPAGAIAIAVVISLTD